MDPLVALIGWVEFAVVLGAALFILRKRIGEKDLPRVAVLSAGIFVAQMVNFPIGGGTTGHLIGGTLFAILVGPWLAIVGMTVILVIQALLFGDGGITSLGLNGLNMAVIAPLTGWGLYSLLNQAAERSRGTEGLRRAKAWTTVSVAAGAWASVFLAAAACAAELSVSFAVSGGAYGIAAPVSVPAMLGYNALIGVGEAAITVGVFTYVSNMAPEMLSTRHVERITSARPRRFALSTTVQASVAILMVFALVLPLYFVYSIQGKDGLEKTMDNAQVQEGGPLLASPFSYGENYFAALLMGIVGFVAVALLSLGLLRLLRTGQEME
jgi:cobalt/nickel transport system permease protein